MQTVMLIAAIISCLSCVFQKLAISILLLKEHDRIAFVEMSANDTLKVLFGKSYLFIR